MFMNCFLHRSYISFLYLLLFYYFMYLCIIPCISILQALDVVKGSTSLWLTMSKICKHWVYDEQNLVLAKMNINIELPLATT